MKRCKKFSRLFLIAATIVFFVSLVSCTGTKNRSDEQPKNAYSSLSEVNLDDLQRLYIDFDSSLSYSDAIAFVEATGLPYSAIKYNGSRTIQVAFTKGATAQKYKKDGGDYLTITYVYPSGENSANDDLEKYAFGTCVYCPTSSSLTLIEHANGSYFSYRKAGNYISKLGNDLGLDTSMTKEEQMLYYFNEK